MELLNAVFEQYPNEISIYALELIVLYIKFNPKLLLRFLKASNDYPIHIVEQKCRQAGLREA